MSLGLILVIILIIFLLGGFSGRFGGYGYGMGHSGMGLFGVILVVLIILLLLGKLYTTQAIEITGHDATRRAADWWASALSSSSAHASAKK